MRLKKDERGNFLSMKNHPMTVMIAVNHPKIVQKLSEELKEKTEIVLQEGSLDEPQLLKQIYQKSPDLVILGLGMEKLDSIEVLRQLAQNPPRKNPTVVLLTKEDQRIEASEAFRLGVRYCIIEPVSCRELGQKIQELQEEMYEQSRRHYEKWIFLIQTTVSRLGVPIYKVGYHYFIDALYLRIGHSSTVYSAMEMYEEIAVKYNTTWSCVESNLRNIIKQIPTDTEEYQEIFFPRPGIKEEKMSNYKMISKLAEYIRMKGKEIID